MAIGGTVSGAATAGPSAGSSASDSSSASTSGPGGATPRPTSTTAPTAAPTKAPSPTAEPTATLPPVPSPTANGGGAAAGCSGTAANRDFFAAVAQGVSWQVYCAVLPAGWFIETGNYQLGSGGRLMVAYKGPNGARLTLQEGAFCTSGASACSPHDKEIGPARFGDRTGTLVTLGSNQPRDGYAVYVAPGAAQSWAATGTNVSQDAFQAIVAALNAVGP